MLPMGMRVMKKIERHIETEMHRLSASRCDMPLLLSTKLWEKSGRCMYNRVSMYVCVINECMYVSCVCVIQVATIRRNPTQTSSK